MGNQPSLAQDAARSQRRLDSHPVVLDSDVLQQQPQTIRRELEDFDEEWRNGYYHRRWPPVRSYFATPEGVVPVQHSSSGESYIPREFVLRFLNTDQLEKIEQSRPDEVARSHAEQERTRNDRATKAKRLVENHPTDVLCEPWSRSTQEVKTMMGGSPRQTTALPPIADSLQECFADGSPCLQDQCKGCTAGRLCGSRIPLSAAGDFCTTLKAELKAFKASYSLPHHEKQLELDSARESHREILALVTDSAAASERIDSEVNFQEDMRKLLEIPCDPSYKLYSSLRSQVEFLEKTYSTIQTGLDGAYTALKQARELQAQWEESRKQTVSNIAAQQEKAKALCPETSREEAEFLQAFAAEVESLQNVAADSTKRLVKVDSMLRALLPQLDALKADAENARDRVNPVNEICSRLSSERRKIKENLDKRSKDAKEAIGAMEAFAARVDAEYIQVLQLQLTRLTQIRDDDAAEVERLETFVQSVEKKKEAIEQGVMNSLPESRLDQISLYDLSYVLHCCGVSPEHIDTLVRHNFSGREASSTLNSVAVVKPVFELEEILQDNLGISNLLDRKRLVHILDVLNRSMNVFAFIPHKDGDGGGEIGAELRPHYTWSPAQLQKVLEQSELQKFGGKLGQVSGDILPLLTKRKDVRALGITDSAEQEQLLLFISSVTEDHPGAAFGRAGAGSGLQDGVSQVPVLRWSEIREGCDNFAAKLVVGEGGFGKVYKGRVKLGGDAHTQGRECAVKRLNVQGDQGDDEFLREVEVLALCKHPNLLPLLAVAMEGKERCLVYPFMAGGSLDRRFKAPKPFGWQLRIRVATEILRGITYLHGEVGGKKTVLHRDIKAENVLLDQHDGARLSDVGLARLLDTQGERRHLSTNVLVGTPGYICPVFASEGKYYPSSDGYSVGVVLLQLLTGLPAVDPDENARPRDLATKMRRAKAAGAAAQADAGGGEWHKKAARDLAKVAVSLIQSDDQDRMTLTQALSDVGALRPLVDKPEEEQEPVPPRECLVCLVAERAVRFTPCGHMVTCKACAEVVSSQLGSCPLCSEAIEGLQEASATEATFKAPLE